MVAYYSGHLIGFTTIVDLVPVRNVKGNGEVAERSSKRKIEDIDKQNYSENFQRMGAARKV